MRKELLAVADSVELTRAPWRIVTVPGGDLGLREHHHLSWMGTNPDPLQASHQTTRAASLGIPNIPQVMLAGLFGLVATTCAGWAMVAAAVFALLELPLSQAGIPWDQLPCWTLQRDGNVLLTPCRGRWHGLEQRKTWQKYENFYLVNTRTSTYFCWCISRSKNYSKVNEDCFF